MNQKASTIQRPEPKGIALVVCDSVFNDPSSNKRALVGLFDEIRARSFPAIHARMCVYVSFTEVYQNTRCKLDIIHGESEAPVLEMEGPVPAGPIAICDMVFDLQSVQFNEPGTYFIRFWGNERPILERPFKVQLLKQEGTS